MASSVVKTKLSKACLDAGFKNALGDVVVLVCKHRLRIMYFINELIRLQFHMNIYPLPPITANSLSVWYTGLKNGNNFEVIAGPGIAHVAAATAAAHAAAGAADFAAIVAADAEADATDVAAAAAHVAEAQAAVKAADKKVTLLDKYLCSVHQNDSPQAEAFHEHLANLLGRYACPESIGNFAWAGGGGPIQTVQNQLVKLSNTCLAASVKTHYQEHIAQFTNRFARVCLDPLYGGGSHRRLLAHFNHRFCGVDLPADIHDHDMKAGWTTATFNPWPPTAENGSHERILAIPRRAVPVYPEPEQEGKAVRYYMPIYQVRNIHVPHMLLAARLMLRYIDEINTFQEPRPPRQTKSFKLLPTPTIQVNYIRFDGRALGALLKVYAAGHAGPGPAFDAPELKIPTMNECKNGIAEARLFPLCFNVDKFRRGGENYTLRGSFATDGYGIDMLYDQQHSTHTLSETLLRAFPGERKREYVDVNPPRAITEIVDAEPVMFGEKDIAAFTVAQWEEASANTTFRAVDPGRTRPFVSVVMNAPEGTDSRDTVQQVSAKEWQHRIDAHNRRSRMMALKAADQDATNAQSRLDVVEGSLKSISWEQYSANAAAVLDEDNWNPLWNFASRSAVLDSKFQAYRLKQRALAKVSKPLCTPIADHKQVALIFGNAGRTRANSPMKGIQGNVRGILKHIKAHRLAKVVFVDEFRTSMLAPSGQKAKHPQETRPGHLEPTRCPVHGHANPGHANPGHNQQQAFCTCHCSKVDCNAPATHKRRCAQHARRIEQRAICYHNSGHQHRTFNRDVMAAINIGCRWLAKALGLNLQQWARPRPTDNANNDEPVIGEPVPIIPMSWTQIFAQQPVDMDGMNHVIRPPYHLVKRNRNGNAVAAAL
jgi:hypothetical protein